MGILELIESQDQNRIALTDATVEPPNPVRLRDLLRGAHTLAARCTPHLTGDEPVVGVHVGEGALLMICQIAVLHAGALFVLLEPCLPVARLDFILDDTNASLLLQPTSATVKPRTGVAMLEVSTDELLEAPGHALAQLGTQTCTVSTGAGVQPMDKEDKDSRLAYLC